MPVDLSKLNKLAILTNVELAEAGPLPASNIFLYLMGRLNSLSRSKIAIAEFSLSSEGAEMKDGELTIVKQSYWRRRDPETNETLHNIQEPKFTMTPDLSHRMIGSRTHVDASLAWDQPSKFGRYTIKYSTTGMLWHYRDVGVGTLFTMNYTYYTDGTSQPDTRFSGLFW